MLEKLKETIDTSTGEKQQSFLLKLSDAIRDLKNPIDVEEAATKTALDFMEADRCHYSTIDGDNVIILQEAVRGNLPSVAGVHNINSFALYKAVLKAGRPFVVDDVCTSEIIDKELKKVCLDFQYGSFINVPVLKNDKPVGLLSLVQCKPRKWTDTDLQLSIETAERIWAAVERAKAEEKLKESEEAFRAMADSSPVLIWTFNANGTTTYYNKTFLDFVGVAKSEDIYDWNKIIHPDDIQSTLDHIDIAIAEQRSFSIECRLLRADGQWRWVLAQGNPKLGVDNEFLGFVGSSVDFTERREVEAKIKKSEKKFEAAILAVEGIIWTNNAVGEMVGEQPGWAKLTGQSFEEYQGFKWSLAVHPEDAQPTVDAWNKAVKNKSTFEFEHRLKTAQNGWRLFAVRAVPTFDENGIIDQWVGVHSDITEQREAAKKIKESESYFRSLTDTVPAIIWITDPDGSCSYLNKHWYDFTGQTGEEAKGFGWLSATHPDDKEKAGQIFVKANAAQKPFFATYRLRNSKGEYRWAVNSGSPKFNPEGVYEGMIGTVVDVHEEKLAQEQLIYRTALLEAHTEASVDGVLLVDAKGKILSFNQRFIEIWNMPQDIVDAKDDEAALSFAMSQLVNPQQFIDKVKYLYDHPTETSVDELEFKDGKIIERNGYPVIGEGSSYYAWSWTFRDITKQKNYERTIIESEQRFRILAETLPQLIWMTDEKGSYEYASSHWINYSGLDPYVEDSWEELIHPQDLESLSRGWKTSLQTGKTYNSEARLKSNTGVYNWHLVQCVPIMNESGTVIKWIGAFTDIENLKEEQRQKNDFLSMASHELKTPVTTIKAYGQIIERLLAEKDDLHTLDMVKKMSKQVDLLATLIKDLLDVTKMQKGGLIRHESTFYFDEMVNEVLDDMRKTILSHKIVNDLNAAINIKGDKDKLGQVLINLISNATKYSPGADKIIVSTQIVEDGVQLSVQDFGIGISPLGIKRIFEQFYRVTGENQSTFQGMGIGLYICAEIIKKEGGKIWVESAVGKGSVFYVWLPVDH